MIRSMRSDGQRPRHQTLRLVLRRLRSPRAATWSPRQELDLHNCFLKTLAPDGNCSAAPRHGEIVGDYVNAITKLLEPARRGPHGFFVSNCLRHHCIDGNYSFDIRIGGESLVEAIGAWAIDGKATRRLDAPQLQSNPTCPPASL